MKGNQTGVAVTAGEVEDGDGAGGGGGCQCGQNSRVSRSISQDFKRTTVRVPLPGTKINFVPQFSLSHMLRCGAVATCLSGVINGRWL